jgi:DNA mismatch endonuclease (patch repair protein)
MDKISKETRSRNMAAIKSENTTSELAVRKILFSLGYRYRLHKKELPGKPDIYIKSCNTVVFVNGCFWHQHSNCRFATMPKSNRKFWNSKLKRNIERDKINIRDLKKLGYKVIIIWECEVKKALKANDGRLAKKISKLLG